MCTPMAPDGPLARRDDDSMNPTDLTNALLYGIPVVLYAGVYGGFDNILTRRGRPIQSVPGAQSQGKRQGSLLPRQ